MNNLNEDVKIPKEYFNISNIPIYHTEKNHHRHKSESFIVDWILH